MKKPFPFILFGAIIISGCTTQQKFTQTELYFGLSQSNGNIISDSAWNIFVQQHISKTFPQGFTIINSEGRWVDETDKKMYAEPSRVIVSVYKKNRHASESINSLISAYETIFQQEAVLRVDKKIFADF